MNDIRIRIGTDALKTVASTVPNDSNWSFVSSDSMLFDQQSHDAEGLDATQSAKPDASRVNPKEHSLAWESSQVSSDNQMTIKQARDDHTTTAGGPGKRRGLHRLRKQMIKAKGNQGVCAKEQVAHEQLDSQFHIMQYVEGVSQPFRLVFGSCNSSESKQRPSSIRDTEIDGTNYACAAAHAGEPQNRHMHVPSDEPGFQFESEAAAASAIVDVSEVLWESGLELAERSSSHTEASKNPGTSALHAQSKAQNHKVGGYSWSQHASQGDQSRIGSSHVTASLPSLNQEVQLNTLVQGRAKDAKRRDLRTNTLLDQEEQLWQNFVFGSGEDTSSGEVRDRGLGSL